METKNGVKTNNLNSTISETNYNKPKFTSSLMQKSLLDVIDIDKLLSQRLKSYSMILPR